MLKLPALDPNTVGADQLATMPLLPGVQLQDVATVTTQLAPQSLDRDNGTQQLTVSGTILGALIIQTLTTTIYSIGVPTQSTLVFKAVVVTIVCLIQSPAFRAKVFHRKRRLRLIEQPMVAADEPRVEATA